MSRSPRETGRRWLEQATEDLRWADHLAVQGGYHIACFLAQQLGEKALKAFLYAAGEEIVLGHSVGRLCAEAPTTTLHSPNGRAARLSWTDFTSPRATRTAFPAVSRHASTPRTQRERQSGSLVRSWLTWLSDSRPDGSSDLAMLAGVVRRGSASPIGSHYV